MIKGTIILLLSIFSWTINVPKQFEKRINKEISTIFDIKEFSNEPIMVKEEIQNELTIEFSDNNLHKIISEDKILGYFYIGEAFGKLDYFDFVVIFDKNLIVKKIKILAYREDYGGEISSNRWLKQFASLTKGDSVIYNKDIKAISGATISAKSMTAAINDVLQSLAILQNHKLL